MTVVRSQVANITLWIAPCSVTKTQLVRGLRERLPHACRPPSGKHASCSLSWSELQRAANSSSSTSNTLPFTETTATMTAMTRTSTTPRRAGRTSSAVQSSRTSRLTSLKATGQMSSLWTIGPMTTRRSSKKNKTIITALLPRLHRLLPPTRQSLHLMSKRAAHSAPQSKRCRYCRPV